MSANRLLYASFALILIAGIGLTGFDQVHWLLYVPLLFSSFAALTGICLNLIFWKSLGFEERAAPCLANRAIRGNRSD